MAGAVLDFVEQRKSHALSACVGVFGRGKEPGTSTRGKLKEFAYAHEEGTGVHAGPRLPAHPQGNRERDAGARVAAPLSPGPQRGPAVPVPPPPSPPLAGATRCCAAGQLPAPWTAAGTAAGAPPPRGSTAHRCRRPGSWFRPASGTRRFRG